MHSVNWQAGRQRWKRATFYGRGTPAVVCIAKRVLHEGIAATAGRHSTAKEREVGRGHCQRGRVLLTWFARFVASLAFNMETQRWRVEGAALGAQRKQGESRERREESDRQGRVTGRGSATRGQWLRSSNVVCGWGFCFCFIHKFEWLCTARKMCVEIGTEQQRQQQQISYAWRTAASIYDIRHKNIWIFISWSRLLFGCSV